MQTFKPIIHKIAKDMNIKRQPLHILSAAAVLLLAASACTQDETPECTLPAGEYPLVINATGLQTVATPASIRATVDGDWQGVTSVALQLGTDVKEYDVTASDADGHKTATLSRDSDPFYWTSRNDITVSAWWPYAADDIAQMPAVLVKADQSALADFQGSDFIAAENQTVHFSSPTLAFKHRTARVTVNLQAGTGITSVTGAKVTITGLNTENGNPADITAFNSGSTYEALLAPQTVKADMPFIQVDLNGGTFYFTPQSDAVLDADSRYTYNLKVNGTGLELTGSTVSGWADGGSEEGEATLPAYTVDEQGNYVVYTAEGLEAWGDAVRNGDTHVNCTLMGDIDMTGRKWTTVGDYNGYEGIFDGQGHSIKGLDAIGVTNIGYNNYSGLFGHIGAGGIVKNLQLEVVAINPINVNGGIAGRNSGTIMACSVTGKVEAPGPGGAAGGIAGHHYGSIIACWSNATLAGGITDAITPRNFNTVTACFPGQGTPEKWNNAIEQMNAALTDNDYQWTLGTDGLPELQKKP